MRTFEFSLYVDGRYLGRSSLTAGPTTEDTASWYLPWLTEGTHNFRLVWHNGRPGTFLEVLGLELIELGSYDTDENGIADWLDSRLAHTSHFDETPIETWVSPLTIEGGSLFPEWMQITVNPAPEGAENGDLPAHAGLSRHFYSHVPLDPTGPALITVQEPGALATYTLEALWVPYNVVEHDSLTLRPGDSLLLAAWHATSQPSDPVTLTVRPVGGSGDGFTLDAASVLEYTFDQSGEFEVVADYLDAQNQPAQAIATLSVVGASLQPRPFLMAYFQRPWVVEGLDARVSLEADSSVLLLEDAPTATARRFQLKAPPQGGSLLARLGENGPILTAFPLEVLVSQHTQKGTMTIVETFEDGTQLWKLVLDFGGPVPDDLVVTLDIFKAGVTFEDGTLFRTVTAADFNSDGTYTYYMLRPPTTSGSVCHRVRVHQGNTYLGLQY